MPIVSKKSGQAGFALPAVLVMMAGLLVLLVALMIVVELERKTARASTEIYRAELAVESGLEEAKGSLAFLGGTDSFVVAEFPMAYAFDDNGDGEISADEDDKIDEDLGEKGRPYLFGIQGQRQGSSVSYDVIPLFSTTYAPDPVEATQGGVLRWPEEPGLAEDAEQGLEPFISVAGSPHKQAPVTNWRFVRDINGNPVARYSYWVEDMQGYLDPALAPGNASGRANELWPATGKWNSLYSQTVAKYKTDGGQIPLWPAPGINPGYQITGFTTKSPNPMMDQIALYTLPYGSRSGGGSIVGRENDTSFDDQVRQFRDSAPTGRSLMTMMGVEGPLERQSSGPDRGRLLQNGEPYELARALEENITRGNRSWRERALIPFSPGINPSKMGQPKMNLNAQLARGVQRRTAVNRMADHIRECLPDFEEERKGGFPEDYAATLAANALDYADSDSDVSSVEGVYRGVENTPFVSEFLRTTTFAWEGTRDFPNDPFTTALLTGSSNPFIRKGGRLYLGVTVRVYAELWNPSNHGVTGSYRLSYQNNRMITEGFLPETSFADDDLLKQNLLGAAAGTADSPLPAGVSGSYHELEQLDDDYWYFPAKEITLLPNEYQVYFVGSVRYLFDVGKDDYFAQNQIELLDGEENSSFRLRWGSSAGGLPIVDRAFGGLEVSEQSNIDINSKQSLTFSHVCANSYRELFGSFANGMGDLRMNYYATMPLTDSRYPGNYSPNRRNVRYETIYSRDQNLVYGRTIPSEWPDGGHDSSFDFNTFHKQSGATQLKPDDAPFVQKAPTESAKSPVFISNLGRFISETELGRVFDPMMWEGPGVSGASQWVEEVTKSSQTRESTTLGGGNTLRIGRPEHSRFYEVRNASQNGRPDSSLHASHLLDIFHAGVPNGVLPADLNNVRRIVEGQVNINTASRDVLRALAAGYLATDPLISSQSTRHDTRRTLAPQTLLLEDDERLGAPSIQVAADRVADAIIAGRPYLSRSELAQVVDFNDATRRNEILLGNPDFHPKGNTVQWTDSAAEEVFARLYNSSTIRSRNFQVHVIGQSLKRTPSGVYQVGSTKKKSYRVFVDSAFNGLSEVSRENVRVEVINEINL